MSQRRRLRQLRPTASRRAAVSPHRAPEPSRAPRPADTRLVAVTLGLICGCLGYTANVLFNLPVAVYLPESAAWTLHAPPGAMAIRFYGGLAYLVVGGVLGWALGRLAPVASRLGRGPAARWLAVAGAGALAVAMASVAYSELSHWAR